MRVVPKQADEFTCSSCFLVHHRNRLAHAEGRSADLRRLRLTPARGGIAIGHTAATRSVFELRRHSEILRLTESAALVAACPTPSMMPPSPSRMPRINGSSDWSKPSL